MQNSVAHSVAANRTTALSNVKSGANGGAQSLLWALSSGGVSREYLHKNVDVWLTAIDGFLAGGAAKNSLTKEAQTIGQWYAIQSRLNSYSVPHWKVSEKHSLLFAHFKRDPFYHLKNLVEIVMRQAVEAMLRAQWLAGVKVHRTSDADDVLAGVDLIVETKDTQGVESVFGIDVAVSDNTEYLGKKAVEQTTRCAEYNAWTHKGSEYRMPRQVLAISPAVMSYFLVEYMRLVAMGKTPQSADTLRLFQEAKTHSSEAVRTKTATRVAQVLTPTHLH